MTTAWLLEQRALRYVFPVMLVLLYAWIALVTAWLADDSYISFRQVLSAVEGDGFTWNYGQRVQAFTHPSWVLLLTAVVSVTGEIYLTTIALSVALSLAAVVFVIKYAALLAPGRSTPFFLYGFLVALAFSKSFTDYMTSGLENPLSFFLVGLVVWQSKILEVDAHKRWAGAVVFAALALAFLNRFDYAVLLLPLALYLLLTTPRERVARAVLPGAALIAAWFSFSLLYFGAPLPNTYYAKLVTGYPMEEIHARGAAYFSVSASHDPVTAVLIACGTIAGLTAASWLNRSLSLGIVFYGAYVFNAGGDFMEGRFFAVLAYVAVFNLISLDQRRTMPRSLKAAFLLVALAAAAFGPKPVLSNRDYRNVEITDGVADERGVWYEPYGLLSPHRRWPRIGPRATRRPTNYRLTCAGSDGLVHRDVFWVDICGLSDAFLSRLPAIRSRDWRIGHSLRQVPTDYGNVLTGRSTELHDAALQGLLDDVQLAVSGPLFSVARMKAIVRLNSGHSYEYDVEKYSDPTVQIPWSSLVTRADYAQVSHAAPDDGTQWVVPVAEGVVWMQDWLATPFDVGLSIVVQPSVPAQAISLSLDGNDAYRVIINDGDYITRIEKSPRVGEQGGLVSHRIEFPAPQFIARVKIEPIEGDGYYGLGHLLIEGI